jgi:hypothetical protein
MQQKCNPSKNFGGVKNAKKVQRFTATVPVSDCTTQEARNKKANQGGNPPKAVSISTLSPPDT